MSLARAKSPRCLGPGFFSLCFNRSAQGRTPLGLIYPEQSATKIKRQFSYPILKCLHLADLQYRERSLEDLVNDQGRLER